MATKTDLADYIAGIRESLRVARGRSRRKRVAAVSIVLLRWLFGARETGERDDG